MHMHQVEVTTNEEGNLVLIQDGMLNEDAVIVLSPEQVPIVCEWMMRAISQKTETHEVKRLED